MKTSHRFDISIIRVFSTILIVLCHIIANYWFLPGSQVLGQVFNVGVDVFFVLSGYLFGSRIITEFKGWIKRRLARIWIPVVLILAIDIIIMAVTGTGMPSVPSMVAYLLNLQGLLMISWKVFSQLFEEILNLGHIWFMTIIMLCYFCVPLFQRMKIRFARGQLWFLIIEALVTIVLRAMTGFELFYIVIFHAGYYLGGIQPEKKAKPRITAFVSFGVIVLALFSRLLMQHFFDDTVSYDIFISFYSLAMGIAIVLFVQSVCFCIPRIMNSIGKNRIIQFLDADSLYIYVVHYVFCRGILNVYEKFSLLPATLIFVVLVLISSKLLWALTDFINGKLLRKQ